VAQGQAVNRSIHEVVSSLEGTSLRHLDWRTRLQYSYLLRVPILIAVTISALPIVSLHTSSKQLLGNLFVVDLWNIFWTMVATEMLVLGLLVVFRIVLLNGKQRFDIPQAMSKDVVRKKSVFLPQLLILPMWYALAASNGQVTNINDALIRFGVGFLGILAALVAAFAMLWLSVLWSPRYPDPDKKADPEHPPHKRFYLPFKFMQRWIDWACDTDWITSQNREALRKLVRPWPNCMKAGYFDPDTCLPFPGQLLTIGMLILSYGLYQGIGSLKHHLRPGVAFGIPAIAYVVMLLIVLNWLLSVAAFFLDYFLLPLLLPAAVFVLSTNLISVPAHVFAALQPFAMATVGIAWVFALASFWSSSLFKHWRLFVVVALLCTLAANVISSSDHFYEIRPAQNVTPVSPSQVLGAAFRLNPDAKHPNGRLTLVATAGGGIQAAAWTARVLTGLQEEVKTETPSRSFANSIAAISCVSGGAVGTMFFVDRYQTGRGEQGFPAGTDLSRIVDDAQAPALSDIAWAMVYPDLTRAIIPFAKLPSARLIDRGWALEQTWRRRGHLDATLDDWRNGVTDGFRPAVIFNSTIVESGEPLLLTTTDLSEPEISGLASKTLSTLLPGYDVPVLTAVRLAASFPFVTPASRALYDPVSDRNAGLDANAKYHLVDGGYYDNYGINGLLQFLGQALRTTPKDKIPDILILQIRSFPTEKSPPGQSEGWFFQGWAPLSALMNVRTSAQLLRDREALGTFVALWSARGVKIRLATFEFQGDEAPLSWQMNQPQIDAIQSEWEKRIAGPDNQDWLQVNCFFNPQSKECESLPQLIQKGAW
jgi:hypothetical protein